MTGPTDVTDRGIRSRQPGVAPAIHNIRNDIDAARFGLQPWERDYLLTRCIPDRDGGRPAFIFCHIQEGSTVGSLEHFVHGRYPNGQRVTASCTVTIQRDGSILGVIPERHGPWTNGAVRKPSARGQAVVGRGGNPNRWTLSLEMEGYHNRAITEAQMRSAEWWIRDAAARHGIPLDRDYVLRHADVDSVQRQHCPGGYFEPLMGRLLADPKPAPRPSYGTVTHFPAPVAVTVTVDALNARQWGDLDAPVLETWPRGRRFYAVGFVIGDAVDGENRWYIASGRGLRVWTGGTDRAGLGQRPDP